MLPVEHPFATTVNARNIPLLPGTNYAPYLLMEGLAPRLLDGEGNIVHVERCRLISNEEKQALRMMLDDPRVLLGVSGGGKTRMLCEMLADE